MLLETSWLPYDLVLWIDADAVIVDGTTTSQRSSSRAVLGLVPLRGADRTPG